MHFVYRQLTSVCRFTILDIEKAPRLKTKVLSLSPITGDIAPSWRKLQSLRSHHNQRSTNRQRSHHNRVAFHLGHPMRHQSVRGRDHCHQVSIQLISRESGEAQNPYQSSPPYEKLRGSLAGFYSRRINIQHRLIYQVLDDENIVKVLKMWNNYGD